MNTLMRIATIGTVLATTACMDDRPEPLPGPGLRPGTLSGTVNYRERIALPDNAMIEVKIVEVSRMDAPSRTIGQTRFPARGKQVPIPYMLRYRGDRPRGHAEYAVQARIEGPGGRLLFITDTRNPLPTGGRLDLWLVNAQR